ncbi:hypothetical protein [Breznakia pachnodae]|uniref:Uncharacterized protein n=1 Tax=Breznakia pachnodae TaxID=265178 RepID=A0ABU0E6R3_9FIRM|nr:hypothetical protein [Breznakia pachnodae]MDQ0362406.1 hypothetical protein [Breznakia pachnodae]
MNNDYIPIPKDKLEQTKIICGQELLEVRSHQECNIFKNIISFLYDELKHYLVFSLIGLVFVLLIHKMNITSLSLTMTVGIYFAVLALISCVEFCKNSLYQMDELLGVSMIQLHMILIYKTISVMIIEFISFFIISFFLGDDLSINIYKLFIYVMIPILIANVSVLCIPHDKLKPAICAGISMGIYTVTSAIFLSYKIANDIDTITFIAITSTLIILYAYLVRNGITKKKEKYTYGTEN